jgi:hypothetical protein
LRFRKLDDIAIPIAMAWSFEFRSGVWTIAPGIGMTFRHKGTEMIVTQNEYCNGECILMSCCLHDIFLSAVEKIVKGQEKNRPSGDFLNRFIHRCEFFQSFHRIH